MLYLSPPSFIALPPDFCLFWPIKSQEPPPQPNLAPHVWFADAIRAYWLKKQIDKALWIGLKRKSADKEGPYYWVSTDTEDTLGQWPMCKQANINTIYGFSKFFQIDY